MKKAAAGESADGVVLQHLGDALLKLGQRDEALAAYRRAEAAYQNAGETGKLELLQRKLAELK